MLMEDAPDEGTISSKLHVVPTPRVRFHHPNHDAESRPRASLGTLTLMAVLYTGCISGGYGLEESVSAGGPFLTIVFLILIPIFWGIPLSLCVAELACAVPSNAGPTMWVNVAFNPCFCFCTIVWTSILNFVDNSLYPTILADYSATLFELSLRGKIAIKLVFLWSCALINILGVHIVGKMSVGVMIMTLLPFALIFLMQLPEGLEWHRASKIPETIHWSLFIPVVVWNFSGFESAGNVIEEVSNPNKTFVRALILMIIAALLTYIPPILVGVSASALWNTPFEAWDVGFWVRVAGAVGGYNVAVFMMIGGAVSTFGLMVTQLATTSRSLAGIGSLNAFPLISKWLSQYSPKWGTPVNAIVANTLVTSIISSCFTFNILVQVDQIFYSLRVLSILSAFLKLRASHPTLERPYRVPGGAVGAAICGVIPMIFSIAIVLTLMFSGFDILLTTVLAICGTVVVAFVWTRHFRPCGFDGSLVEVVEDGELQAYGSLR